jgi:hypothetical protein
MYDLFLEKIIKVFPIKGRINPKRTHIPWLQADDLTLQNMDVFSMHSRIGTSICNSETPSHLSM